MRSVVTSTQGFAAALILALTAIWTSGCSREQTPALAQLESEAVVLAFGDSITYGTGASASESYPAQLEQRIGRTVIRSGVPGETTAQGLKRLPGVLDETDPDLVILCLGGNDMLRKQNRDNMKNNLAAMIEMIQAQGIPVVLLGVPEPALFNLSVEPRYQQLAEEFSIPVERDILASVLSDDELKADRIHPNAAGYSKVASAIETLLRKAGAI